LLAFFIISSSTKLSSRFCSGVTLLRKFSTLAVVGLILLFASFVFFPAILKSHSERQVNRLPSIYFANYWMSMKKAIPSWRDLPGGPAQIAAQTVVAQTK
jgi:hypothetical protein